MPTTPNKDVLATKPKYFRAPKAKGGIAKDAVDRTGGYAGAGIIRGVSVVTRGEALGHGVWLDDEFVQSTVDGINSFERGAKVRFTHPGLSGDGLGTFLGRVMEASKEDGRGIADLHFAEAGHKSPDGDLASYVMDLAEEDPESFGLSIVYDPDWGAEDKFQSEHEDERGEFTSPDPDNEYHMPHARLASLRAADVVDDPAANPSGLFHRGHQFASEASALASYALGITTDAPKTVALGLEADRVRGFVTRFLTDNKLEIRKMADEATATADATEVDEIQETTTETSATETETATDTTTEQQSAGKRFIEAFGQQGAVWFLEGKTFEDCLGLQSEAQRAELAALRQENEQLQARLSVANPGEKSPLTFTSDEPGKKGRGLAGKLRFSGQAAKS